MTSNSGKRVEKVTIRKQGNQYFAQRENEPSIYELDAQGGRGPAEGRGGREGSGAGSRRKKK